jgi:hypothetical protein
MIPREEIASAKERLTIPVIWALMNLPGRPGSPCKSPFRKDRRASFSVYDSGQRFKDHATGEGGDSVSFFAKARGIEMAAALREFIELANGRSNCGPVTPVISVERSEQLSKPNLSRLRKGTREELIQIAQTRNLDVRAVELAQDMGTLRFGRVCGVPSWILTDASGLCAEARRLDGKLYPAITTKRYELGERKAHTLRHSKKNWPTGLLPAPAYRNFEAIAMVEGAPDLVAVLHFMLLQGKTGILPVAMLGRGQALGGIHPEALELFRARRVRIYPHNDSDEGGYRCASEWARQLKEVGADVDFFLFKRMRKHNGKRLKDFNDCCEIGRRFAHRLEELFAW